MEPGMYILDGLALKAFLEPCLPMRDATQSVTGRAVLEDDKQTMEDWRAIFHHVQEVGTRGNEEGREDLGLRRFATAMKTPRGRVNTDLLNSPKQLCMTEEGDNESFTSAGISWEARASHLKSSRIRCPSSRGSSGCETETPILWGFCASAPAKVLCGRGCAFNYFVLGSFFIGSLAQSSDEVAGPSPRSNTDLGLVVSPPRLEDDNRRFAQGWW